MHFPQFVEKHRFASFATPQAALDYLKQVGHMPDGPAPHRLILCYQSSFRDRAIDTHKGRFSSGAFRKVYCLDSFPGTAIGHFGIGAASTVYKMELLIAWGVKEFLSIGTAGSISPDLQIGDLVGCDRAIRDEGASHHYLPPGKYSFPTDGGAFAKKFDQVGTTWTIDAFFRHTKEEIDLYAKEGVLTVDMEAAALFALGQTRKVSVAAAFCISDLLSGPEWHPRFRQDPVEKGLDRLLELALTL